MKLYAATIYLSGRGQQRVTIEAKDVFTAKAMLEATYGKGNVQHVNVARPGDR